MRPPPPPPPSLSLSLFLSLSLILSPLCLSTSYTKAHLAAHRRHTSFAHHFASSTPQTAATLSLFRLVSLLLSFVLSLFIPFAFHFPSPAPMSYEVRVGDTRHACQQSRASS